MGIERRNEAGSDSNIFDDVSKALSALNAVQLLAYDELDTITIMKVVSAIR